MFILSEMPLHRERIITTVTVVVKKNKKITHCEKWKLSKEIFCQSRRSSNFQIKLQIQYW